MDKIINRALILNPWNWVVVIMIAMLTGLAIASVFPSIHSYLNDGDSK